MWVRVLLVLASLACGDARPADDDSPAPVPSGTDTSAPTARPWVTRNTDGAFDVAVSAEPRTRVLDALAGAADFGVVPGQGRPAPHRLTLHLEGVSVDEALTEILAGVPHHVHYERGANGGPVALRRVTVGLLPPPEARGEGRARLGQRLRERRQALAQRTPEDLERLRIEREERAAERTAWIDHLHDSPLPRDRSRAATLMKPDRDLDALVGYLLEDESADVRERAAESLADASAGEDALTAAEALLEALADPEPAVVAAAVAALEDVHDTLPDARIREAVGELSEHPDPAVREAVEDFVRWTAE
jgi:hypothetical protein